jgi:hypothetical protein
MSAETAGSGPPDQELAEAIREARETLRSGQARESDLPEDLRHLPERERAQELALKKLFAQQEHDLRESYAQWIIRILFAQLAIADTVFIVFAWAGQRWVLSPGVIEVWLGATVVQVVGIVLVVTRHLFPNRDRHNVVT